MPLISMFPCSSGGGASIDYNSRPQIDFNGSWLAWHIEFYDSEPYWEAWFFTSGTLTVEGSYTADAWGIGGGGARDRGDSGDGLSSAGATNQALGVTLSGSIAVTIGAGGMATSSDNARGGSTKLGSILTCDGGSVGFSGQSSTASRNRFGDASRNEYGRGGDAGDGWLEFTPIKNTRHGREPGHGFGAGAATFGTSGARGASGALVIRIKI